MKIKQTIKKILIKPAIATRLIFPILRLHNFTYHMASLLSAAIEPNGLHPKHRLIKYHEWFIQRLQRHWNVLDIGCGNGALAYNLKNTCKSVFAIDINQENIKKAISQFSHERINYICADATKYPFRDKFDAIILSNTLEHIENRVGLLQKIYANQNQQNPPIMIIRVPMITRDWITLYKKEKGVLWKLDNTHYTEYTLDEIHHELAQAGLFIQEYEIQYGELYAVVRKTIK